MVNRQFYTMKFNSSRLKRFNYNINITFDEAKELKEIIALADNQILRSIRDIQGRTIDYDGLEMMYAKRNKLKSIHKNSGEVTELAKIQSKIYSTMFVPEYITIFINHPKHYEYMYRNGVIINGKTYKRLSCSSSQARNTTVVFCDENIIDKLRCRLNNGRNESVPLAPSKFNAYFGLNSSATHVVSNPRFVVVKDYKNKTNFMTNFVTEVTKETKNGEVQFDESVDDKIDIREVEMEMNRNDGMGLISPSQSKKWAEELGLDWVPSQWCVRQSFLKGMLCTFDFHKFCKQKNEEDYIVETIYKDQNGNYIKADLRDCDVIITESQFKLWDSYNSIEEYITNCNENRLYWGISQYTPKEPKDILTLNYQFIQTLNLSKSDVDDLCEQFVKWIDGVTFNNPYYTMLFLLGANITNDSIKAYFSNSEQHWIKSFIVNPEIRNDKYIRKKIYDLIKHRIQNGCLGSIIVDGNFQVLVSDPYAFMQYLCKQEVTGLLEKDQFYSGYWNNKNIRVVDGMRSPLTYRSEHVVMNLVKNNETEEWYKYCQQGIILNYFGHEVVNFGGADFDYDILATTSNKTIIKGVYKNELPVVYNPPKPEKIIFTEDDLYEADTFSFGSIIGQITNKGSNGYALLPLIEQEYGADSDESKTLVSRLQQCCKAQSAQIDKAKIGKEVKGIPLAWIKRQEILESDTEEKKKEKKSHNSILLTKHPYFFKYLYKDAKKQYSQFIDFYEMTCSQKFRMSLSKLLNLHKKTTEQVEFIKNFYKYMPLTYSDSSMNLVCRHIEEMNFNISEKLKILGNDFDCDVYKDSSVLYSDEVFEQIASEIKNIKSSVSNNLSLCDESDCLKNRGDNVVNCDLNGESIRDRLSKICVDVKVIVNCLIDYYYKTYLSSNKDILWSAYGDVIYDNILSNTKKPILFPFQASDGDINYLGKKYKLQEVELN